MDKVRFGVIGVGNMGTGHLRSFKEGKIPEGVVTAVADINPKKFEQFADIIPADAKKFTTAEELIHSGAVDAIIIAVPHYFHPGYVVEGLNAGLHVMSEKPAGVYTKQVREMLKVAEKSDKIFGIMFQNRTNPLWAKMHEIVASGKLGEIRRTNIIITDWYRSQSYYDSGTWRATWRGEGGGVLLNQCPHNLDLWQWIVGMLPTKVSAFTHNGKWHDIEVEDDVSAYVEYPNGATGTFVTSTADLPGTNRFEIQGNNGKLVADDGKLTLWINEVGEREFNATYKGGFGTPGVTKEEIDVSGDFPQHPAILNNFCDAILHGAELWIPGSEGIKGLTLSNAMHLSSWLGRPVDVPLDEDLFLSELNKRIETSVIKNTEEVVLDFAGGIKS